MARALYRLTFPVTRAAIAGGLNRQLPYRLVAWPALVVATFPYIALRGIADETGLPRQQLALQMDRVIGFGSTPSERLQGWFFSGDLSSFDWLWMLAYASWFFLPLLLTGYVVVRRWPLFLSLAAVQLSLYYVGLIGFFLMPTEPPWMATEVTRVILGLRPGEAVDIDTNPVAAMPSLHVALPIALAIWSKTMGMNRWAWFCGLQGALIAFAVVYLGEHYLVDVIAGIALAAITVRWVAPAIERRLKLLPSIVGTAVGRRRT